MTIKAQEARLWQKVKKWTSGNDTSVKKGGNQIEYKDQPNQLHKIWLKELAQNNVPSEMGEIFNEPDIVGKI